MKKALSFRYFALCVIALAATSCIGLSVDSDPAGGMLFKLTVKAEDCIKPTNLVGKTISVLPWVGPYTMTNYGCALALPEAE